MCSINASFRILSAISVSALVTAAHAASGNPHDNIVVTSTRTEQISDEVVGSVTIITRSDIERRQVQSVQDLLRGEMGVDITNQGGLGKFTSLFMRGASPGHILVLIDGARAGNATSGTTAFEYIPLDQIERIEIVRGPRSSVYGSDAISGVIQIFTRRASPGVSSSVGIASDETYRATARLGLVEDHYWFSLSGDRLQTDGYNSCRGTLVDACFTIEPDLDGYRNTSGTLHTGYRWSDRADVNFSALYGTGRTQFDGSFQNEAEFRQFVPTVRGRLQVSEALTLRLALGASRDDVDNFHDGDFRSEFNTERRSGSLQSDWQIANSQLLTFGFDYVDDLVDSTTAFEVTERNNLGWFAVYQARSGDHQAELSVRRDDNEQFGDHTSGNIGWKWHLADSMALMASYGTAFRAPTFNDLYFPGFSNSDLDPENAVSYEIGLTAARSALRWSVNAFVMRIDDMINLNSSFVPENISKARIYGVEGSTSFALGSWDIDADYTWLDPRNRGAGPDHNNLLQRRARHSVRLEASREFGSFAVGSAVRAQSARYNNAANTVRLSSYAVADVFCELQLGQAWFLQAKIANLLDREYETVRYYNEPDRSYALTLRYEPRQMEEVR